MEEYVFEQLYELELLMPGKRRVERALEIHNLDFEDLINSKFSHSEYLEGLAFYAGRLSAQLYPPDEKERESWRQDGEVWERKLRDLFAFCIEHDEELDSYTDVPEVVGYLNTRYAGLINPRQYVDAEYLADMDNWEDLDWEDD